MSVRDEASSINKVIEFCLWVDYQTEKHKIGEWERSRGGYRHPEEEKIELWIKKQEDGLNKPIG